VLSLNSKATHNEAAVEAVVASWKGKAESIAGALASQVTLKAGHRHVDTEGPNSEEAATQEIQDDAAPFEFRDRPSRQVTITVHTRRIRRGDTDM
jgi:hypothetical protein